MGNGDTDRMQAIKLEHLSPTWVLELDQEYGEAKQKNGGYLTVNVQFEGGKPRPHWWDSIIRRLPYKRGCNKPNN